MFSLNGRGPKGAAVETVLFRHKPCWEVTGRDQAQGSFMSALRGWTRRRRGLSCWPTGPTGTTAGINRSPATQKLFQDGLVTSCVDGNDPWFPGWRDSLPLNYSGVPCHYRPLDATRPIVPCILISRRRMREALFLNWSDEG